MSSPSSLVGFILFLTFISVHGNSCGGLLAGDRGHFVHVSSSIRGEPATSNSSCVWIIQLQNETTVRFTLDALRQDVHLIVYPEDQLTPSSAKSYIKLNSTHVGSSIEFAGKTLIVVLPNSLATVGFSWDFRGNKAYIMKNSKYIRAPNGLMEWGQLRSAERATWGINTNENLNISWKVDLATSCDSTDHCTCFYFAIFQLDPQGILREAARSCGQSAEGKLQTSGPLMVLIDANTTVEANNKIAVSWEQNVTAPPEIVISAELSAPGVFAATGSGGLVRVNLETLEAKALTNSSNYVVQVAVNNNLGKVYWSEGGSNSRILRANFDGSASEIIVPQTGNWIDALAIDEETGNIYFSVWSEITVCNAAGNNCAPVLSSLFGDVTSMALDTKNGVIYWASGGYLVRSSLSGTNAAIISTEFTQIRGMTLREPTNDVLYWADYSQASIGTIGVDGSNKRVLAEIDSPYDIQVDFQNIYVASYYCNSTVSIDRDYHEISTIFTSTTVVRGLALFNVPSRQSLTLK